MPNFFARLFCLHRLLSRDHHPLDVEIFLKAKLDSTTNNYCFDIAGGNKNIDINKGLQAHTCYSYKGKLGPDQIFDKSQFSKNKLFMSKYNVCANAEKLEVNSPIGLSNCNSSQLQQFKLNQQGKITSVVKPNLCITAAKDTRFGKSKKHQIKKLNLQACSDELARYQAWGLRSKL